MYTKGKSTQVPSDAQSKEKLAIYVYEYLIHVGAPQSAEIFLKELHWEKKISLSEPPGFLQSWWSVFWDLYCAAPERRETNDYSNEAKAFHDYGFVNSGYGVNGMGHNAGPTPSPISQMPPNDGMSSAGMPPYFPNNSSMRPSPPTHPSNQQSPQHPQGPPPHSQMMSNQFMGARFPGGPRQSIRMSQMADFNNPPGQQMMQSNMEQIRQGEAGEFIGWQGPSGMNPMNPRINPPRGPGMSPMGPGGYGPNMRGPPPNSGMGPNGPGGPGGMPPMNMTGARPQWQPNTSTPMSYSSPSPGNYGGPPGSAGPPGPGTPIMQSPQDSSNSGNDNMYTMMKSVPGGNMQGDFGGPMGGGPEGGPMGSMGSVLNGDGLDGMKNSPANGPGTPREDNGNSMNDYNLGGFGGPGENISTESAAILKIKESMQEEAKRFESDIKLEPDYY